VRRPCDPAGRRSLAGNESNARLRDDIIGAGGHDAESCSRRAGRESDAGEVLCVVAPRSRADVVGARRAGAAEGCHLLVRMPMHSSKPYVAVHVRENVPDPAFFEGRYAMLA